jgi:hypothetical protein
MLQIITPNKKRRHREQNSIRRRFEVEKRKKSFKMKSYDEKLRFARFISHSLDRMKSI